VHASGELVEDGSTTVRAGVSVGANRGMLEWKDFDRVIDGALKGHVTSIFLVSSDGLSEAQLELPLDPPSSSLISSGTLIQRPGDATPNLSGLYELLAGNRAVLEISTDIASRPIVRLPLAVTAKQDWYRPHNCY
jgi:hypothetical protein